VAYAKARFVDMLPDIDVPGHSLAAVVSCPTLSCTTEADAYSVGSAAMIRYREGGIRPLDQQHALQGKAGRKGKPFEGSNAESGRLKLIIVIQAAAIAVLSRTIYRKSRKNAGDAKR
jgi:hypothetical protein